MIHQILKIAGKSLNIRTLIGLSKQLIQDQTAPKGAV